MERSPVSSFFRFFALFVLFISLSFGLTYSVNSYTVNKAAQQAAAAAKAAMLQQEN